MKVTRLQFITKWEPLEIKGLEENIDNTLADIETAFNTTLDVLFAPSTPRVQAQGRVQGQNNTRPIVAFTEKYQDLNGVMNFPQMKEFITRRDEVCNVLQQKGYITKLKLKETQQGVGPENSMYYSFPYEVNGKTYSLMIVVLDDRFKSVTIYNDMMCVILKKKGNTNDYESMTAGFLPEDIFDIISYICSGLSRYTILQGVEHKISYKTSYEFTAKMQEFKKKTLDGISQFQENLSQYIGNTLTRQATGGRSKNYKQRQQVRSKPAKGYN